MIVFVLSLSARKLWIEITIPLVRQQLLPSLSARKLWIEIVPSQELT